MLYRVTKYGEPVLKTKSQKVEVFDADLKKLTDLELTLVKEQVRRLKEAS